MQEVKEKFDILTVVVKGFLPSVAIVFFYRLI